jgi:hypothetical protein
MSEKYICDKCNKEVWFEDVAYLGTDDECCDPFQTLDCYFKDCHEQRTNNTDH